MNKSDSSCYQFFSPWEPEALACLLNTLRIWIERETVSHKWAALGSNRRKWANESIGLKGRVTNHIQEAELLLPSSNLVIEVPLVAVLALRLPVVQVVLVSPQLKKKLMDLPYADLNFRQINENYSEKNNFPTTKATEKQQAYLESYIIQDSETVHHFCVALTIPKI